MDAFAFYALNSPPRLTTALLEHIAIVVIIIHHAIRWSSSPSRDARRPSRGYLHDLLRFSPGFSGQMGS